jgi:translation initiation factor IF-1
MKLLYTLLGAIVFIIAALYGLAFTSVGNALVAPSIEKKINEALQLQSSLKTFKLGSDSFEIVLELTPKNTLLASGTYALFSQSFDAKYALELDDLEALKSLSKTELYGAFHTKGHAVGDMKTMTIKGQSDIASSNTTYDVTLTNFNPSSIKAVIEGAKTQELLALVGKAPYALSTLDIHADMSSIDPNNLQGDLSTVIKDGHIDTALMKRDFNVTLPKTEFRLNSTTKLAGERINYDLLLASNLAKLDSKGSIEPKSVAMDLSYQLNIAMLELLKPITNAPLRGKFNLKGTVKGNKQSLHVKGESDLAKSTTTFDAELKEFQPKSIIADIKNLHLPTLLHMLEQPHYLNSGSLNTQIRIKDATAGALDGEVIAAIAKGSIDTKTTAKAFDLKPMPKSTFFLNSHSTLKGDDVTSNIDFNSNLATLSTKMSHFNIGSGALVSDYTLRVIDLSKLYFATGQKMRGAIVFNGDVKKDENLDFTAHSSTLDGTIDAHLHNDDFKAELKNLQTLKMLHMLYYPEIFKSSLNGKVNYNLATQKGTLKSLLSNGRFTKNQMADLTKQYAKFDLYKERFNTTLNSDINKELITTNLSMQSNKASITDEKLLINTKTNRIKANLKLIANKHPITIKLSGDVSKPKVKIDAQDLVKQEATKAVKKELGSFFKKFF